MSSPEKVTEKVIVITGASTGIGAATAQRAVAAGHKVVLAARSAEKLTVLVQELGPENAQAQPCDVTDPESISALFAAAKERFGRIDAVFANAGIGATVTGTENGEIENWRQMIDTNIFGLTVTAKLALPYLKETRGHIVMTSSVAGFITQPGSVYGATKWYVRGYAENLRAEVSKQGIRVTAIGPGMVDTPFFDDPKPQGLRADDIARGFMYAIEQPENVDVAFLNIYPMPQNG